MYHRVSTKKTQLWWVSACLKGFIIISIYLNESMGMRSQDWNVKELTSPDIVGAISSANHRSPSPQIAASISWARRVPNSIRGSSSMTERIRAALVAISVWKLTILSRAVSTSWHWASGPFHLHDWFIGKTKSPSWTDLYGQAHLEIPQIIQKLSVIAQGLQII